ncbi:hypothetical protein SCLCIDRAFT_1212288 [Scleroderma citrinum Foug A]|uniref:Uncharacterized protein n=1 Tax=Scleroderma citrinum Foug A TaxID=1036808 RepID=A0A0C3EC89_9AGAM|nr:hypothetical protein SCLCIDRAFT_1212288 [Scleroderma citrinum Foug A]
MNNCESSDSLAQLSTCPDRQYRLLPRDLLIGSYCSHGTYGQTLEVPGAGSGLVM